MGQGTLQKASAVSSVLYVAFVAAFIVLASMIPEVLEGESAAEFLPAVDEDQAIAVAAGWTLAIAPLLIALVGLGLAYWLRDTGPVIWIAGLAFVGGGFSILYRAFMWVAMTYELAPAYVEAEGASQEALAVVGDTLATFTLGADMVGAVLIPGVGVPLFSIALRRASAAGPWLLWIGLIAALVGGWLTLLAPLSGTIELLTFVGFIAFIVWMVCVGAILWRAPSPSGAERRAATSSPRG